MKRHLYEYEELVVGSNLAAIMYAYINNRPLLFREYDPPFSFEYLEKDFPLDKLFLKSYNINIKTPAGDKIFGPPKIEIYDRLLFSLSLSGLVPVSDKVYSIRLEDEETLKISTERSRQVNMHFETLRIFEPRIVNGLITTDYSKETCTSFDRFRIRTKKHDYDLIDIDDIEKGHNFVNKIWFVAGKANHSPKEAVLVSRLFKEDLNEFDYSVIPMKYKIQKIFEKVGIVKRDYDKEIKLDFVKKDVYHDDNDEYITTDTIIVDKRTEKEICLSIPHQQKTTSSLLDAYPWRLNHLFSDSSGMIR